ncbi:MAG: sulfotransferase family 2 domain-containing protein [Hyphomicrobiaceae bacterium]
MSASEQPLRIFVHVPKCGGRTIQRHLALHLRSRFWSVNKRSRHFPLELLGRKYHRAEARPIESVVAISGHFLGRSIENLFPERQFIRTLILREPEQQFLSWYNFRMMRYISAGHSPYSFRLFLRSMPVDPVAHFLLERWLELPWLRIAAQSAADKIHLLNSALEQFDIVADITRIDEVLAWHSEALGIPQQAVRENEAQSLAKRTGWRPVSLSDLRSTERDELTQRLQIDRYLWRKWALKQDVTFDPSTTAPFVRKEFSRVAPQVLRRVVRSRAFGKTLQRL